MKYKTISVPLKPDTYAALRLRACRNARPVGRELSVIADEALLPAVAFHNHVAGEMLPQQPGLSEATAQPQALRGPEDDI